VTKLNVCPDLHMSHHPGTRALKETSYLDQQNKHMKCTVNDIANIKLSTTKPGETSTPRPPARHTRV
jgi:hypothetical protein